MELKSKKAPCLPSIWTVKQGAINVRAHEEKAEKKYFKSLNRGKLAGNSDHYPFAQRGVPCIFLENEGGDAFQYYHTPLDTWERAIFDSYEPTFRLVRDFIERY